VDRGNGGEGKGEYDDQIIDFILVALFSDVGVSGLWMVVTALPCFAGLASCGGGNDEDEDDDKTA
jgi:hypothetical protein